MTKKKEAETEIKYIQKGEKFLRLVLPGNIVVSEKNAETIMLLVNDFLSSLRSAMVHDLYSGTPVYSYHVSYNSNISKGMDIICKCTNLKDIQEVTEVKTTDFTEYVLAQDTNVYNWISEARNKQEQVYMDRLDKEDENA